MDSEFQFGRLGLLHSVFLGRMSAESGTGSLEDVLIHAIPSTSHVRLVSRAYKSSVLPVKLS